MPSNYLVTRPTPVPLVGNIGISEISDRIGLNYRKYRLSAGIPDRIGPNLIRYRYRKSGFNRSDPITDLALSGPVQALNNNKSKKNKHTNKPTGHSSIGGCSGSTCLVVCCL
jgi:hypothetical protein